MDEADYALALCRSVNVLNAIEWTVKAWKETLTTTVVSASVRVAFELCQRVKLRTTIRTITCNSLI